MAKRLYFHACCFTVFFVAASVSFHGFYAKWHFREVGATGFYEKATFEDVMNGTAYRPFVFRLMIPDIANFADRSVPESVKTRLYNLQGTKPDTFIHEIAESPTAQNPVYFFRYAVVYATTFVFALLALYAMFLVCRALSVPEPVAVFAPVILMIFLPYVMSRGGYFYDYPELAFCALAVFVVLKLDWWWLLPVTALGTWNKESFLLFVLTLYPFFRLRYSRKVTLAAITLLVVVCLVIYLPIRFHFAMNRGGPLQYHWRDQLEMFLHPRSLLVNTDDVYGVRSLRAFTVVPMALLVWTVWRAWRGMPEAVRRHAQIAAAINVPLFLLFCLPGELRDLSLLYIALLAALAVNLRGWMERTMPAAVESRAELVASQ